MAIPYDTTGATWLNLTPTYDAGELRRQDAAFVAGGGGYARGGIARHSDTPMNVTVDASLNVTVQPGSVIIPGNAVAETGVYRDSIDAPQTGTLAARHATNPRIDLVIFRILDSEVVVGHAAKKGRIEFVTGTPGAVPSAPALPSMAVELGRVTVPQVGGPAPSVDLSYRTYATAAGGELPVPAFARLPAAATKWQRAVALDTGRRYTYNGTAWVEDGGWIDFGVNTPNLPLSAGATIGRVSINNRTIEVHFRATASGVATGSISLDLPYPAAATIGGLDAWDGNAMAYNSTGGGSLTPGLIQLETSTRVRFLGLNLIGWSTAAPHTWKAGDALSGAFSYEMA